MRITWYSHSGICVAVCDAFVEGVWLAANYHWKIQNVEEVESFEVVLYQMHENSGVIMALEQFLISQLPRNRTINKYGDKTYVAVWVGVCTVKPYSREECQSTEGKRDGYKAWGGPCTRCPILKYLGVCSERLHESLEHA
jgi:hypothetical protein